MVVVDSEHGAALSRPSVIGPRSRAPDSVCCDQSSNPFAAALPHPYPGTVSSRAPEGPGSSTAQQPALGNGAPARNDEEDDVYPRAGDDGGRSRAWSSGVLTRLVNDSGRWVVIIEVEASDNRYVQFLATEDGGLVAEVVSNVNLWGDELLSPADEERLRALGWQEPDLPERPNWWRDEVQLGDVQCVSEAAITVLHEVFGVGDEDALRIKLFRSPLDPALHAPPVEDAA